MSQQKAISEILLRSYPKIIFLWPTLACSFAVWIIAFAASAIDPTGALYDNVDTILASIWMVIFASNVFIMAFDFQSTKFFMLILAIIVIALVIVILYFTGVFSGAGPAVASLSFPISMNSYFYFTVAIVLAFILFIVWVSRRVDYYKIERNEIYHKNGFLGKAERIPTSALTFEKEIPDVFEYLLLRAGSLTLHPARGRAIYLSTVPNINKIEKQLDILMSRMTVEVDDTTTP